MEHLIKVYITKVSKKMQNNDYHMRQKAGEQCVTFTPRKNWDGEYVWNSNITSVKHILDTR